jgi:hypothetical protein
MKVTTRSAYPPFACLAASRNGVTGDPREERKTNISLNFMGDVDPNENPLDGELEADLPEEFKRVKPSKIVSACLERTAAVRAEEAMEPSTTGFKPASKPPASPRPVTTVILLPQ